MHLRGEGLLEDLEDGLHSRPSGLAHVDDHGEGELPDVVAGRENIFELGILVHKVSRFVIPIFHDSVKPETLPSLSSFLQEEEEKHEGGARVQ